MIISFIGNLLHNTKRKMGRARSLYGAEVFQVDRLRAEVIEEAYALPQQHVGNAHLKFVEQARLQGLLDRTGPVKAIRFSPASSCALAIALSIPSATT